MNKSRKFNRLILLVISISCLLANLESGLATSLEQCEEGTSAIEYGWTTSDGELFGAGHSWAGYEKSCGEGPLALRFNIKSLVGGMHANINVNGPDRYAVGLNNTGDGLLIPYLFKQEGEAVPPSAERLPGEPVAYNQTQDYRVDIRSNDGHIQVFVYEADQEGRSQMPVIDYLDPDPLPSGRIDFEALNESFVHLSNVLAICPSSGEIEPDEVEETPNLGDIYFERPDVGSLVQSE
jgi:hypothetical protein